jgi:hypothetical protein
MDVSFLDSLEPEDRKVRSSLSFSRSEASLWLSEGESESDEPVDVAPATTPRRPTPARPRASILRRESRRLTAALLSWQRSVAVPESLFSELEGKRRRDGSRKAHAAPRFVAAPDSWLALAFSATGFVLTLTHVALLTPAFVAFDAPTRLGAPAEPWPWTAAVDLGVGAFFLANLLVNFRTGVLCSSRTLGRVAVVLDPSSIARVYVKSGALACDAAALLPLVAQCVSSIWLNRVGAETAGAEAHISRLIRLFRLFHLARLGRASGGAIVGDAEALLARGTLFPPLAIWLAQTACEFVFVINTCACAFVYVAHVNGFENSWVRDALERDELASADAADPASLALALARADDAAGVADVYVCALYWAAATVSTVGYGDVAATNRAERVAAVAVMTAGSTWFASLVGRVAALVERHGDASRRREAYREKMVALRCFLRRHPNVPRDLRLRLAVFFSDTWARQRKGLVMNDRALLAELPEALRRETRFRALETAARAAFADDAAESEEEEKKSPSARFAPSRTRSSRDSFRGTSASTRRIPSRSCARARWRWRFLHTLRLKKKALSLMIMTKKKTSTASRRGASSSRRARFSASLRSCDPKTAKQRTRASRRSPSPSARCTRWTPSAPARSVTSFPELRRGADARWRCRDF